MTLPAFHRPTRTADSRQLAALVEQLRERLGAEPPPGPHLVDQLESVLTRLVMRNQRWRVLQRLERAGGTSEHMDAISEVLTRLDVELLEELPLLLEHLGVRQAGAHASPSAS